MSGGPFLLELMVSRIYYFSHNNDNNNLLVFPKKLVFKKLFRFRNNCNSQGAERTKVHVYLPYRGAISFYVYIVPLSLISIFLYVGRVQISCGLLPTRIGLNFPIKLLLSKKVKFQIHF